MDIPREARLRGTYLVGKPGTGKSAYLTGMICRDVAAGSGAIVLDPHGHLVESVLGTLSARDRKRVEVLELTDVDYPFGLNIYQCADPSDPLEVARTVSPVMQLFERLWGAESNVVSWGPRMAQFLRNSALTLVDNPGTTMVEIPLLLTLKAVRQKLVARCTNPSVRAFWEAFEGLRRTEQLDRVDSTFNKVDDFVSSPLVRNIVGQAVSTMDVDRLMAEQRVLLVKLDPQLHDLTAVVGALLISRVLSAALKRQGNAPLFALYADEYQRFATPDFATLLSEARKYNIATTIAHQFRGQLDAKNRGASLLAGSTIVFEVTPEDAKELSGLFDATPPEPKVTGQRAIVGMVPSPIEALQTKGHPDPQAAVLLSRCMHRIQLGIEKRQSINAYLAGTMAGTMAKERFEELLVSPFTITEPQPELVQFVRSIHNGMAVGVAREAYLAVKAAEGERTADQDRAFRLAEAEQTLKFELRNLRITYKTKAKVEQEHADRLREIERDHASARVSRRNHYLYVHSEEAAQLEAIFLLGQLLKRQPIFTETGQYEPIYESERQYADVGNEIANRLATQGRFHAWAKIGGKQTVGPIAYAGEGSIAAKDREEIRRRSRERYGRPRSDVEREIKDRQDGLMAFESSQPPTKPPVGEAVPTFPKRKGPPPRVSPD